MTPFRKKPIKWDGNTSNGQYKNRNGYKFDILNHKVVERPEDMPKHFLADTLKEAEALYKEFEQLLNGLSYNYSVATGMDRADLFGEALIGLARAKRDWNPKRSKDFKTYALYRVRDALAEYARKNKMSVCIPSYVKKANSNLKTLETLCKRNNIELNLVLINHEIPQCLSTADALLCATLIKNLINASNRARVDYKKFVERIRYMSKEVTYTDNTPVDFDRYQELLETALIVKKLETYMTKEELEICKGIMEDKSYTQIARDMHTNIDRVKRTFGKFRKKAIKLLKEGN